MCITKDLLKEAISLQERFNSEHERLVNKKAESQQKVQDLLHKIENDEIPEYQAYQLIMAIKHARKDRREAWDELIKLGEIKGIVDFNLEHISKRLDSQIKGLNNRKYAPRILTNLFEN